MNYSELGGPYHQVVMTEVLEHIKDDKECLRRIHSALELGGRLILSTPTAIGGGEIGYVSPTENGDHVRVGYQGPELDKYLIDLGFIVVYRTYYGYGWAKFIQRILDLCLCIPWRSMQVLLCACTVIFYRLTMFMDLLFKKEPAGQITMAIKVSES